MDKHYENLLLAFEEAEKAPYIDLELRQRKMLAEWNNIRGYSDNHWNDELVNETVQ